MNPLKRWRYWAFVALPLLVIVANSFGPDGWHEPLVRCLWLAWSCLCVGLAHSARTALFDYARAKLAWDESLKHPVGAGLSFLGICIVTAVLFLGLIGFARAQPVQTFVPVAAQRLAPVALQEINTHFPGMPSRSYLGGLVEQETCVSLRHRYCWSPTAQLKTAREEGAGLGQLTRSWSGDGRLRFDALAETRALAPVALQELTWSSVYQRADLGLRAVLVKLRDCDARLQRLGQFASDVRVAFCDAAYNGGAGGLQSDRKLCALKPGCDPAQWFGHVEHTSGKSRAKWQGYGQSAFDINREHVRMAVLVRRPKYVPLLGA